MRQILNINFDSIPEMIAKKVSKKIIFEYGHVGYQTFSNPQTKRLVKKSGLCDLTGLRKIQKCVFLCMILKRAILTLDFSQSRKATYPN